MSARSRRGYQPLSDHATDDGDDTVTPCEINVPLPLDKWWKSPLLPFAIMVLSFGVTLVYSWIAMGYPNDPVYPFDIMSWVATVTHGLLIVWVSIATMCYLGSAVVNSRAKGGNGVSSSLMGLPMQASLCLSTWTTLLCVIALAAVHIQYSVVSYGSFVFIEENKPEVNKDVFYLMHVWAVFVISFLALVVPLAHGVITTWLPFGTVTNLSDNNKLSHKS